MAMSKCLPVLYLVITWPTATPISPAPASLPARTRAVMGASSFSVAASSSLAGAGAVGGQDRVAAGDQPLAGEVRAGDLGQVLLVEEAELQRPAVGHELSDGRGAQRGDPPVSAAASPVPSPAVFSAVIRALVIMPRSPTMTIFSSLNCVPHHL